MNTQHTEVEPIPFNEVTEQQVYEAYEANGIVSSMYTWIEVKASQPMYMALQHQASTAPVLAAKQMRHVVKGEPRQCGKTAVPVDAPIRLTRSDVRKIKAALSLARNTLQSSSPGSFALSESVAGLYHAKQIIDKKLIQEQTKQEKSQ